MHVHASTAAALAAAASLVLAPGGGSSDPCARTIRDQADPAACLAASSVPTLGQLFPVSPELYVDATTDRVGIGTTNPISRLEVRGDVTSSVADLVVKAAMRPSLTSQFGVVETYGLVGGQTTLASTVSIDPQSGAMATRRNALFLTTLSTPVASTQAGYLSILSDNVETAGINGQTGIVFGASKSFVQPHPDDPERELVYVSLEGPEHGVYARGTSALVGGEARVALPDHFRLVAREEGLTVSVTPLGPTAGLYVPEKGRAGFVVRESPGGSGDARFDWVVLGVRSAMPEHEPVRPNVHFAPEPGTRVGPDALPGAYRDLLIRNGTLLPDGTVDEATAARLGWRLEDGRWVGGASEAARPATR